jgi:hypothetical protein
MTRTYNHSLTAEQLIAASLCKHKAYARKNPVCALIGGTLGGLSEAFRLGRPGTIPGEFRNAEESCCPDRAVFDLRSREAASNALAHVADAMSALSRRAATRRGIFLKATFSIHTGGSARFFASLSIAIKRFEVCGMNPARP